MGASDVPEIADEFPATAVFVGPDKLVQWIVARQAIVLNLGLAITRHQFS